jgi:hypothetical protein
MMSEFQIARHQSRSVPGVATIAVCFLISLFYLALCMDRNVNVFDEGEILFGASRVMEGDLPYRDFYIVYPPGQYYVLAALFKIFGASVLVERAWDTVVRAGCVALVLIVVNQAAPRQSAILAAAASLVFLGYAGYYGYPVFPALLAALGSVACLAQAQERPGQARWLMAGGICAGITVLFRHDVGVAAFGVECAILAVLTWFRHDNFIRPAIGRLIMFGAGFALVVLPVAVYLGVRGVLRDMLLDLIIIPAQIYVKGRSLPFPRLWMLRYHPEAFAVYLPVIMCTACIPVMTAIAWSRRRSAGAGESERPPPPVWTVLPFTAIALTALTFVFFAKGWVHVSVNHMAMAVVSSLALLGVMAQPMRGCGVVSRVTFGAVLAFVFVFTLSWLYGGLIEASGNIAWAVRPESWEVPTSVVPPEAGSCGMPAGLERMACFRIDPESAETARYVDERTTPDDPVFVGLSRHDKIFINDILLYFIMNRKSVTKWVQFDPGVQTSEPVQREIVRDLERAKPKLIVIEAIWLDWREPNGTSVSSGVTVLDDYIRGAFEPVATFGANTIMRPRSAGQN